MIYNRYIAAKLTSYFKDKLGLRPYHRGWMKGDCPFCLRKDKFGVNVTTNRTNCFTCGYNKKPLILVQELENLTEPNEVLELLKAFDGAEPVEIRVKGLKQRPMSLPEGFRPLLSGDSLLAKLVRKNLKSRGFNLYDLTLAGVGYCVSGKYGGRIIFPFYEKGNLVYFTARQQLLLGAKFKNPNTEHYGIGKNQLIYNIDAIQIYSTIYIVESVTNALTLGHRAIAIGGKMISQYQLTYIIQSPVKNIIIILDPDAYSYAISLGLKLVNYKKIKVVNFYDRPSDDVNSLGKKLTMKYVRAQPWQNYTDLFRIHLTLPKEGHDTEA